MLVADTGPVPPMTVIPGFSSSKFSRLQVRYLFQGQGNHQPGTDTSAYTGNLSGAEPLLTAMGVSANWVAFHVLNHNAGGLAVDSNLIPTPRHINREYRDSFEDALLTAYATTPVYMSATVRYHSDQFFVASMSVTGGEMRWRKGKWEEDTTTTARFPAFKRTIDLPKTETLYINQIPQDMAARALLLRGTLFTEAMARIILDNVTKKISTKDDLIAIMRGLAWTVERNDATRERTVKDFIRRIEGTKIDYS
jgi:hypothetical protein